MTVSAVVPLPGRYKGCNVMAPADKYESQPRIEVRRKKHTGAWARKARLIVFYTATPRRQLLKQKPTTAKCVYKIEWDGEEKIGAGRNRTGVNGVAVRPGATMFSI